MHMFSGMMLDKNTGLLSTSSANKNQKKPLNNSPCVSTVSFIPSSLSCITRCNVLSHVPGARFIEQSLQVAKNQRPMSSSDTHMFIDNVQELSNDHVVFFIDHFLTMFFAFYIVNISCLNAIFLMSFITPNNKQNETFNIYGFKNTKGIKICSHNVNRMESKFDETKNNLLQSKYPPDIVGFCETFFHEIISAD